MYKGEDVILEYLLKKGAAAVATVARETRMHEDSVRRIAESLRARGVVAIRKKEWNAYAVTNEFKGYWEKGELPEFSVLNKAVAGATIAELSQEEKAFGVPWARQKGWIEIGAGGRLIAKKNSEEARKDNDERIMLYEKIAGNKFREAEEHGKALQELLKRKLVSVRSRSEGELAIEDEKKAAAALEEMKKTPAFNITIETEDAPMGKAHPLTRAMKKIRNIFLEMGFEEMDGSIIDSAFWNFDALFQPQDHPARELADTFYLEEEAELPDKDLVEKVKKAHEKGWKYKWDENVAKKLVLRTHTTASSAHYLAKLEGTPKKYFAIGRVFRNEATDFKHLAEFHQIEGIVVWEKATFCDLLGILKTFYNKLGFERIRFRPSYFPYTEPSLEIEVYFENKKEWMELGGGGIFRPEVSIPLCGVYPVLAWGLSLERPLMLMMELDDIRDFYKNDIAFLKTARIGKRII